MNNELKEKLNENKYEIKLEENVPQFVYGIPDDMRKEWDKEAKIEEKYNIDSKDNYPVEVYGIPKPIDDNENKYEIKPEENIPQKVYGIPKPIDDNENKYEIKPEENIPQKVYGIPNAMPKREEKVMPPIEDKIIVKVKNSDKDYKLIVKVDKTLVGAFIYAGDANKIPTKDDYIGISTISYYTFYRDLRNMLKEVEHNYAGTRDITWSIEINRFGDEPEIYQGNGEVPTNWNLLMDLFAKMDINYKK